MGNAFVPTRFAFSQYLYVHTCAYAHDHLHVHIHTRCLGGSRFYLDAGALSGQVIVDAIGSVRRAYLCAGSARGSDVRSV